MSNLKGAGIALAPISFTDEFMCNERCLKSRMIFAFGHAILVSSKEEERLSRENARAFLYSPTKHMCANTNAGQQDECTLLHRKEGINNGNHNYRQRS